MINPTETDIGRRVAYKSWRDAEFEYGRITSFNDKMVFVLYDGNQMPMATPRNKLDWVNENVKVPANGGAEYRASMDTDIVTEADGTLSFKRVPMKPSKDWNNG
jgi:hypothetical protein